MSRQTNISIPQQTNFVGRLEDDVATIFFIAGTTKNDTLMLILLMIIILNLSSIKLNCWGIQLLGLLMLLTEF